ncbi:MAG: rhomboid family intramembrane serine protease [Myxococcales bacterium]|nr:rhomboid family intramembrane serine protease [Myxococcales bacterium]
MIPLYDDNPTRTVPWVTYTLIVLNAVVFLYELILGDAGQAALFREWGVRPIEYWQLSSVREPIVTGVVLPLFTSMFLHGGFMHIISNMLFLWVFGDNVEDRFGHGKYLLLYLGFGLAATATHILFSPDSAIPTVGASGAISGVLGAYLVFYPRARVHTLIPIFFIMLMREIPAVLFLGIWFGLQVFSGLGSLVSNVGGVAWWAHIGGFVAGAALALVWRMTFGDPDDPDDYEYAEFRPV